MPTAASHSCAGSPTCPALVPSGQRLCPAHARTREHQRPNTEIRKGYHTARWRRMRTQVMQEQPFCPCGALGTELDHTIPHRSRPDLFWERSNLALLCTSCHSRKTLSEGQ